MPSNCDELVAEYLKWLRDRTTVSEVNGACEVTTPFLDRHNDRLQIYVEYSGGNIRLSDDGYVLGDLEASGFIFNTPKRREQLNVVLNGFGVRADEGELFVETSADKFPQKKHALVQAMLAVNDMFMTAQPHVATLFLQDVEHYFEENEVRFSPSVEFTGKTGFVHKFDFLIPRSRSAPERLVRAINRPNRDHATSLLFSWTDTKEVRPSDSRFYVVLNDTEKELSGDLIDAFKRYQVEAIPWSERDRHISELAA